MYARLMPAPFLSVLTDDCIANGRDYNAGGARYNNTLHPGRRDRHPHRQPRRDRHRRLRGEARLARRAASSALDADFAGREELRQRLVNRTPKYGNDDERADELMRRAFDAFFREVDGRPNTRGGRYRIEMLPTTCHVYFGSVTGATPDGRRAGLPLSEGISPVQGADRTRARRRWSSSAAKMDHLRTGGTLLNMKFTPALLEGDDGIDRARAARARLLQDGRPPRAVQRGARRDTLREAQAQPEDHRDLIVRVAGYSDYFCDLSPALQDEIIARTEHEGFA